MKDYDVTVGLDVGKAFHHLYALGKGGEVIADRRVIQHEQELAGAFTELLGLGSVLVVVDQPNNIGALPIAVARRVGCSVAYLPGLAMRRAAGILPGDAKTDGRDAFVICMTAKSMPQSLRALPAESALRAGLLALASYDEDCRCDLTREINRLRAHLVEGHPAFERALGEGVASPFVLKMLKRYGGPWGMRKAGKAAVRRWAAKEKRVPEKTLGRLLDAAWEMACAPDGAALREELAIPACAGRIAELARARKGTESRIRLLLAEEPAFLVLTSMPGIGIKTAAALIIHVDIANFPDADHLASYAGIAPRTHQSGTSIKGESAARAGNRALKNALFLSAFASLRTDPVSRGYYDSKRAEGKKHNAAVICLARRRLKIMYAMMRDLKPYRAVA
jgi:transposase